MVIKYNSSGAVQWRRTWMSERGSPDASIPLWSIAIDSSANIYAGGYNWRLTPNSYVGLIVKYNSSGTLQWQRILSDTGSSSFTYIYGTATDTSNNVYVVTQSRNSSNGTIAAIVKYNSSGTLQWQRTLSDTSSAASMNTTGNCITIDSFNNVYVGGFFKNASGGQEGFIAKYNSSGTLQWQRTIFGTLAAASRFDFVKGISVDSTGSVIVAGRVGLSGSYQGHRGVGYVIKLPADGSKTGAFTLPNTRIINVASSSMTDAAGGLTSATSTYTESDGSSALPDTTGAWTDLSGSLTYSTVAI
jgi:hypothetical protein